MTKPPKAPTTLELPAEARAALKKPRLERINVHGGAIDRTWWNRALRDRDLPGGPLGGAPATPPIDAANVTVTRGSVFRLAEPVAAGHANDDDILRLLWHVLAWGSGSKLRQNRKRLDSFIGPEAKSNVDLLRSAAALSRSNPGLAYGTLIRRGGGVISGLGPSFFTKFLYFAGAGELDHPCAILDARVATALNVLGWSSLRPGWSNWYTVTYQSYCDLLRRWADGESERFGRAIGIDEIELFLFNGQ
ncbi:MAG TPA: hypothetical protein VFE45_17470 [Coriobacteriia bacterium]|nr:hypothetical protein [Coriobacteriia bacterium]